MKLRTEKTPTRHLQLLAMALSFCLALLAWSAGHAHAEVRPLKGELEQTATALQCSPDSVEVGHAARCTATVTGLIGAGDGLVTFTTTNSGSFSEPSCKLSVGEKANPASCSVDYVPNGADGTPRHQLHATYQGDSSHAESEADFVLGVIAGGGGGGQPELEQTATALQCSPDSVEVGHAARCTATVTGLIGAGDGLVTFTTTNSGSFSEPSCKLSVGEKANPASCSVDYVPNGADGTPRHQLHATYQGDSSHAESEADFVLGVIAGGGGGGQPELEQTATALQCSPDSVEVGHAARCTATVTGLIGAGDGLVTFTTTNSGSFSEPSCKLSVGEKANPASCSVDYVPNGADGTPRHQLHATYQGDSSHAESEADFVLGVIAGGGGGGQPELEQTATALVGIIAGGELSQTVSEQPPTPKANLKVRQKHKGCKADCGPSRAKARSSKRG